jgi:uncharacterized OB-fold protein
MELEKMNLGGTPLKNEDIKEKMVFTLPWQPTLNYAWDNGVAIGRYLEGLKEGKIVGKKCNECDRIMIPPRMFCELCFRPSDGWVEVKDTGVVNTFSICRVNWDASRLKPGEPPHLPAVIEIDGASKGMGILHLLGEVDPKEIKIGMKVRAVWKTASERTGAITDIKYWKPY